MSDRPDNGPPPEGPEFGWLYGKRPDGASPHDRGAGGDGVPADDATRVMPVQPRAGGSSGSPSRSGGTPPPRLAPTPAPTPTPPPRRPATAPSSRGGGHGGFWALFWGKRLVNPFFYVRFVMLMVLLFVVYTVAVPFFTWKNVDKVAYEPDGARPAEQPGTTYLMVGSDSRAGLTKAERKEFHTGNPTSQLTDTIMLMHTGSGPNLLLSIPRDTEPAGDYGVGKINAAYATGGPALLTTIIEQETGIRVDKYVEIGLGGVAGVVNAVGGIEICPDRRMDDKDAGLHVKKGCQEADGKTALAYSRSRHAQLRGDLDRVRHQREVVGAIGKKVLSPWSVVNPVRWWRLNHAIPGFFAFGDGMSTVDAGRWALAMSKSGGTNGLTCTVPVTDGSATTWDRSRADPLFKAIIEDQTDDVTPAQCTPTGIAGVK